METARECADVFPSAVDRITIYKEPEMSTTTASATTLAQQLHRDPRLAEAKRLILAAVADHQRALHGVQPPRPELTGEYQQLLHEFGQLRGGALYFPYLSSGLGNGPWVELADGSVKLDMITGIGVHGFGHSHPALIEAGIDAAVSDTVMQGNLQQDTASVRFTRRLVDAACASGAGLTHCFLSTSGAMANENALKIAFQRNAPANRVLAFEHCFAGRTLVLSQVTDKAAYRQGLPDTIAVDYLPFFDADDPAGSINRTVRVFREHLYRHPGKYACLWMELVQGEGGYNVGDREFFLALCRLAREHHIAVIADEVQSFGRTTRLFAFQHFGLDAFIDIVTLGKISQVCATLFNEDYKPRPGLVSQTFTGSTWSILAGDVIVRTLLAEGYYGPHGRIAQLHQRFAGNLERLAQRFPQAISGPFGIGGMVAFTPFDGSADKAKMLCLRLYEAGLMSFIAGADPTRLRFLMPLGCVRDEHIDAATRIIENVLTEIDEEI